MTTQNKQISIKPIRICENCGHNHIAETGGKDGNTLTNEQKKLLLEHIKNDFRYTDKKYCRLTLRNKVYYEMLLKEGLTKMEIFAQ